MFTKQIVESSGKSLSPGLCRPGSGFCCRFCGKVTAQRRDGLKGGFLSKVALEAERQLISRVTRAPVTQLAGQAPG